MLHQFHLSLLILHLTAIIKTVCVVFVAVVVSFWKVKNAYLSEFFNYQLMHKRVALIILKFTAPPCFGVITIIRECINFELAKVTVVKIIN
jgi:hypothetical protein